MYLGSKTGGRWIFMDLFQVNKLCCKDRGVFGRTRP